jgi:flagellar motor switch/type III secretory pathway protein FliN
MAEPQTKTASPQSRVSSAAPSDSTPSISLSIEIGRAAVAPGTLACADGLVVDLDRRAADPVSVYLGQRLVARGQLMVLNGNFAVRLTEVFTASGGQAP